MWKLYVWITINKDMKSMFHKKEDGSREGSGTFMSNTNCEGIEN